MDLDDYYITIEHVNMLENNNIDAWINNSGNPSEVQANLVELSKHGGSFNSNDYDVISSDCKEITFLCQNKDGIWNFQCVKGRMITFLPSLYDFEMEEIKTKVKTEKKPLPLDNYSMNEPSMNNENIAKDVFDNELFVNGSKSPYKKSKRKSNRSSSGMLNNNCEKTSVEISTSLIKNVDTKKSKKRKHSEMNNIKIEAICPDKSPETTKSKKKKVKVNDENNVSSKTFEENLDKNINAVIPDVEKKKKKKSKVLDINDDIKIEPIDHSFQPLLNNELINNSIQNPVINKSNSKKDKKRNKYKEIVKENNLIENTTKDVFLDNELGISESKLSNKKSERKSKENLDVMLENSREKGSVDQNEIFTNVINVELKKSKKRKHSETFNVINEKKSFVESPEILKPKKKKLKDNDVNNVSPNKLKENYDKNIIVFSPEVEKKKKKKKSKILDINNDSRIESIDHSFKPLLNNELIKNSIQNPEMNNSISKRDKKRIKYKEIEKENNIIESCDNKKVKPLEDNDVSNISMENNEEYQSQSKKKKSRDKSGVVEEICNSLENSKVIKSFSKVKKYDGENKSNNNIESVEGIKCGNKKQKKRRHSKEGNTDEIDASGGNKVVKKEK